MSSTLCWASGTSMWGNRSSRLRSSVEWSTVEKNGMSKMNLFLSDELTRSLVLEGKGRGSLAKVQLAQCFSPLEVGFLLCAWRDSAPVLFSSLKSDQLGISSFKSLLSRAGWLELKSKSKRYGIKGSHFVCGCLWEDDGRKKRWCKEGKKWFEVARLSCLSPLGHSNRSWNTNQVFFPCLTRV